MGKYRYRGDPLPYPLNDYLELVQHCPYIVVMRPHGTGFTIHGTIIHQSVKSSVTIPFHRSDIRIPLMNNYPVVTLHYAVVTVEMVKLNPGQVTVNPYVRSIGNIESKIPTILHQSFETLRIPQIMNDRITQWKGHYPVFGYQYHTGYQCSKFIRDHFPPRVSNAYEALYANAYRCDLWRVCQLYITGGLYIDIKLHSVTPMTDILINHDLVLCLDIGTWMVYNAIMGGVAGHPFFQIVIDMTVDNIEARSYGSGNAPILSITGPGLVYQALTRYLGHEPPITSGSYTHTDGTRYYLLKHHLVDDFPCGIIRGEKVDYLYGRHPITPVTGDHTYEITGKFHYSKLFQYRQIYTDEN